MTDETYIDQKVCYFNAIESKGRIISSVTSVSIETYSVVFRSFQRNTTGDKRSELSASF